MTYFLPSAVETPEWETDFTVTESPHHPIGPKGRQPPPGIFTLFWDTDVAGLDLRVATTGAKGFILNLPICSTSPPSHCGPHLGIQRSRAYNL